MMLFLAFYVMDKRTEQIITWMEVSSRTGNKEQLITSGDDPEVETLRFLTEPEPTD